MDKEQALIKNTAIITFGKICTQMVSFFLLPLYTSILTTAEYGTVDLILTYSSLCLPFVTLALEQALFRFLIDSRGNEPKSGAFITTTIYITFGISFFVFAVASLVAYGLNNKLVFFWGLILFASTFSTVSLQICRGIGDNLSYALGSSITAIGQVACNIFFLVVLRLGVIGMMLATIIGNLLCFIVVYFRCSLRKYIKFQYFNKNISLIVIRNSIPDLPDRIKS